MTHQQKIILAALSATALFVFGILMCAGVFLFVMPVSSNTTGPDIAIQQSVQPEPSPLPTVPAPTVTPSPSATPVIATTKPEPTSVPTRVVVETVLPTATPTAANCIDKIRGFGASGVTSDEVVEDYIRRTLPPHHLDHCRGIKYTAVDAAVHSTPIAGNIIPVYREINIYSHGAFESEDYLLDTLVHEIGHNVHYNIRRNNFDLDVQWAELFRQSEKDRNLFISDYAQTNKFEDFAETYMYYIRAPDYLILVNPAKYDYMRLEIFNGQEYRR